MHFGDRVRTLRLLRGYSAEELGRRSSIAPSRIERIEGGSPFPGREIAHYLAWALGVQPEVLSGRPLPPSLRGPRYIGQSRPRAGPPGPRFDPRAIKWRFRGRLVFRPGCQR